MKKPIFWLIALFFISHAGFSGTYVWEDYDDFSGSSLDTSKWEIGYWDGAQAPNIENGKAHLYGTGVGVGSIVPPSMDELVGMPQNGTNQSFLFLKDDLIRGVQAEISLDSTFSGIYLGIMEAVEGGFAYAGIELNSWKQSGPSLEFSNTIYENGTEILESTLGDKPANLGQSYKVSVVKDESAYQLFLDSELIGEYPVRGELLFFSFGGYHDEDLPWDGYIDNVRVITDWEDYEDFSGSNIDTARWSMGHWDRGNLPIVENERLTLTGNTISGFNEVLPTAGMLEFNPDIQPLLEEGFSSSNGTESHSILELIKDDILGIEVEVQLPVDAPSSVAIGLYASDWAKAFSEDQSDKSFFGLDLWRDHIDIEYVDPNTGEFISNDLSTTAGSSHTFAFIFEEGKVFMFVDGGKVAEFSSANFSRDSILIRAWNTAGEPFSAYAKNVRIVRNWEDFDDFNSGSLDSSKWTATNSYFLGNDPTFANGRVELTGLTSHHPHDNTFLIVKDLDGIVGVEADIWLPSDAPADTGALIGIADAGVPVGWIDLWANGDNTKMDITLENTSTSEFVDFNRNAELGTIYRVGVIEEGDKTALFLNGEKVAEITTWQSEDIDILFRGVNDVGSPFTAYLDNVRVLRRSQDTPDPTPVTVVSDQNGNPVVVQLGEEYQWNSTLDGVTLWLVGNDSGSIMHATIKYEAGNYSGNFEFLDEVTDPVDTLSYAINENGYLAHTESLGQQYFQILSAEDGKIGTIGFMNDLSLANHSSEPANFFFTTRAAAEEYYYSKVNPKNWMWFDHYPWVYSHEEQDWLYLYPTGGNLMYWSNQDNAWRRFNN